VTRLRPRRARGARAARAAAALALAALLAAPGAGFAAEAATSGAERAAPGADALALARAGRCEAALSGLAALREASPEGPAALLEAQCLLRLRRYAEAAPRLEAIVAREGAPAEASLHLAMARFHLGDVDGAEAALAGAAPLAERAEHRLYRGLVRLSRGDAAAAAPLLEGVSDGSAAPIASYWAGVAWLRAGDAARGRAALLRARALAPGSAWAEQAARVLADAAPAREAPWWIRLTSGYEYDDNVVLRAGDVPLAREISSQRDTRAMWRVEAGGEWLRREPWSAGAWLDYAGTSHDDLDALDVQLPTAGLWLDRRLDERTRLRLSYDFGWAFVDEASFLQSHGGTLSAIRGFGAWGTTQLFARLYAYDYHVDDADVADGSGGDLSVCPSRFALVCGVPGVDEASSRDRDGWGAAAGFLHRVALAKLRSELSLGYTYFDYDAEGEEQSYRAHELRAGTRTRLPLALELRAEGAWAYRPYDRAASVPEPFALFLNRQYPTSGRRRRDRVARVEVGLERRLADRVRIGILYSYLDSDSTHELFSYDRHIVGSYVTIGFGPGRWAR